MKSNIPARSRFNLILSLKQSGERGVAALEFAFASILLFTALFSIVDFALLGWVNLTMQHAVREGTRYAITGQDNLSDDPDLDDPDQRPLADSRFNAMVQKMRKSSVGFFDRVVDPGDITVKYLDGSDVLRKIKYDVNGTPDNPADDLEWDVFFTGEPGKIIIVELDCTWQVLTPLIQALFPNGEYNFTVGSTMKNERFSS